MLDELWLWLGCGVSCACDWDKLCWGPWECLQSPKETDRLRLLIEACTCSVCYAQLVSVEACTNMYTHTHTHTNTYTDNRNTTKNIHHNYIAVRDHSPRSYYIHMYTVYYYCSFNTIIHNNNNNNNNNTTQFDEYSSYHVPALVSHVPHVTI